VVKSKKLLAILMAVALILAVVPISALSADGVWDGVMPEANQNAAYSGGSGTQSDPFIIATAEDLAQLSVNAATFSNYSSGKYFLQTDDIVLNPSDVFETDSSGVITGIKEGETANIWTPIGIYISGSNDFGGRYDGGGKAIHGVYIDNTSDYQGLFGRLYVGYIINVRVESSYIKGKDFVGGIVGYNWSGVVSNCSFSGTVIGNSEVGGIIGENNETVTFCRNTGAVSGNSYVGGIVGYNEIYSLVTDSYNTGTVAGKLYFGGLVGTDNSGAVTNSYYLDTCVVNPTETDGTALTDSAMKLEESYVGFDFENTWSINPLASYPYPTLSDLTPVTPETPVAGVSLNKSVLDLFAGDSEVLIATIEPADATNTAVFWSSSDDSVATVNQSGLVTGIAEGTAIITVTTEDGSFTASCEVNVERREAPEEPEEDDSCWARFLSCLRRIFNFIKSLFNIYH
jgi:hypothetical protein